MSRAKKKKFFFQYFIYCDQWVQSCICKIYNSQSLNKKINSYKVQRLKTQFINLSINNTIFVWFVWVLMAYQPVLGSFQGLKINLKNVNKFY